MERVEVRKSKRKFPMHPIDSARKIALLAVNFIARHSLNAVMDAHNVDICLSTLCSPESLSEIRYPVAYIEFLRTCIEHAHCTVKEVKLERGSEEKSERFNTMLDVLRSSVPPIDFSVAADIGVVADYYRSLRRPAQFQGWASDIGNAFQIGSSFGKKGRIISTIVRFAGAHRCLELGTAYGMSALFIVEALRKTGTTGHLTTLEGYEPQYSLSSSMLKERYGEMVSTHFGKTQDDLPRLAEAAAPINFVFHDAGHSREEYIRDFNAVRNSFAEGAVVLIDDIRWEEAADRGMSKDKQRRCYEGWMEVCADPKVRRAAEIDGNLGLLLCW
jgi:predicted O-methyltransferase YrrM